MGHRHGMHGEHRGGWSAKYGPGGHGPWGRRHGRGWPGGESREFEEGPGAACGPWARHKALHVLKHAAWKAFAYAAAGQRGPGRGRRGPGSDWADWAGEFERTFRRGFGGGWGGPTPPYFGGPGHGGGPGERRFGRGDIKYLLLDLLRERPMHGYEMIKELEGRHGGFYAPSPGSVYPTLQFLEDRGLVTGETVDGKKVYTITAAGRDFLDERAEHVEGLRGRGAEDWPWGPGFIKGMQAVGGDAWEVGRLVMRAVQETHDDPARLEAVRRVLAHAREELERILRSSERGERAQPDAEPGGGPTVL